MTPILKKYPLDLTGTSPDNLIISEPHSLVDNARDGMRVFVLDQGSFYTEGLVVRDASGTKLTPHTDYISTYLYEEATTRSGLEVCGAVVVTNPNVSTEVYVDYQCVGGDYAQSINALEQVIQTLADDTRPVEWANIIGKPSVYPPGGHLHALWELYGFEYLVVQLERITQAVMVGDQSAFDEMRRYFQQLYEDNLALIQDLDSRFKDHKADYTNPHRVTKAQVGLGLVDNYPTATLTEIRGGSATNRFVSVAGLVEGIDYHLGREFYAHKANKSNPHNVTKSQVGLGKVANYAPASTYTAEQAGVPGGNYNDTTYMTPANVHSAIWRASESNWFDYRYPRLNVASEGAIKTSGQNVYIYAGGAWRHVFPAQWV